MKYLLALVESLFCVVATYIAMALVLFVTSANTVVPGFMSARTVVGSSTMDTSLEFQAVGGAVLFVVLAVAFGLLHRSISRRPRVGGPVPAGAPGR